MAFHTTLAFVYAASMQGTRTNAAAETLERALLLRRVERFLYASAEAILQHRLDTLNRTLEAAMRSEPYRRLYDSTPRLQRLDDLLSLPVVDKPYLATFPVEDRLTERRADLVEQPSTGTTGDVMMMLRTPEENQYQDALSARQFRAQGLPSSGGHVNVHQGMDGSLPLRVGRKVARISVAAPVEKQAEAIRSFRPSFLSGPPTSLLELGEFMDGFAVEGLMTYSELLTPVDRRELRRLFGADPLDAYAASETGFVSWECKDRTGYHVNADAVIVEVLDDDNRPLPAGEAGNLVITTLWNPTMPIIRYRIGDIGRLLPQPCPCGITLPLMGQVEGRENDLPIAHDGRRVSPMRFLLGRVGPFFDTVAGFRIIQRDVDDILVEVVWRNDPDPDLPKKMTEAYSRALGGPVRVELREVERISRPRNRKFRWLESHVR